MNIENGFTNKETSERAHTLEEVFKKYHKDLIKWCIGKLHNQYPRIKSPNLKSDAEEIVAGAYETLLKSKNPIDLKREEEEVRSYLGILLASEIIHYINKIKRQKRIPPESLVPLEEVLGGKEEGSLSPKEEEQNFTKILTKEALAQLEKKDKRSAEIIKARYLEGMTIKEIADIYDVSTTRIRQIEEEALEYIRKFFKI